MIVIVISDYGIPGIWRGPVVLRLGRFLACASLFLTFLCASTAGLAPQTPQAEEPKGVLLLYRDEMSLPGERAADEGIRSVLGNNPDIRIYSEHLDTSLFPDPKFQAAQLASLRSKYRNRRIDLVIAAALPAQNLLPDKPTVFCGMEPNGLSHATLPPNSTAVWLSPDFKGTLAAAARLQPRAHQVVVLSGTSPWDRHVELGLRNTPPPPGTNWDISYWDNISVEEMRLRLAALPKNTIVLYLNIQRDGAGHPYVSRDLIPSFSAVSSAPIYGMSDGFIGFGIVGGSVVSFETQGKQAAELGQRILRGETTGRHSSCRGCLLFYLRLAPASSLWLERKRPASGQHRQIRSPLPLGPLQTMDCHRRGLYPAADYPHRLSPGAKETAETRGKPSEL